MTLYRYRSINASGAKSAGQVEARNLEEAKRFIVSSGDLLVDLQPSAQRLWFKLEYRAEIDLKSASAFALELAALLEAGAPLRTALDVQADGTSSASQIAEAAIKHVEAGDTLSTALRQAGGAGRLLAEFVAAGETGAGLDRMLKAGGEFLRSRDEAFAKIRSALAYPLFICVLSAAALIIMILYVAPALAPIIEGEGTSRVIPIFANIGQWLKANGSMILLALAGLIVLVGLALRGENSRERINRAFWAMPLIGPVGKDLDVGQACEVLAALMESGRPLENALQFSGSAAGPQIRKSFARIAERLRDGEVASAAFDAEEALPGDLRRLAKLGEKSSAFPRAIRQAGKICHDRAMRRLERISALAGPFLVIGMGGIIAGLMLTILGSLASIGGGAL